MATPIIAVENIGKRYRIHHQARPAYSTLRDTLAAKIRGVFSAGGRNAGAEASDEDFWALRDVSFEINQGDVVGIIGRNGAGKSTLLKILSRITEPTTGRIRLGGRVASLLEVGTGFHPELTGRENISLNGAILGMTKAEIRAKFDEIVAFSGVEKFLDTPVKHYSSGMYVRLAFAVAAHLDPEILIVDEVLAVGDAEFQKKCLGKMKDVAGSGRTVLFVSHNMQAVTTLCSHALYLVDGTCRAMGPASDVVNDYLSFSVSSRHIDETYVPRDSLLNLLALRVCQPDSEASQFVTSRPTHIGLTINAHGVRGDDLICGVTFYDQNESAVFSTYFNEFADQIPNSPVFGTYNLTCQIPAHFFNEGILTAKVDVGIAKLRAVTSDRHQFILQFDNPDGIGSRFGLGKSWRKGPLLPLFVWNFEESSEPVLKEIAS